MTDKNTTHFGYEQVPVDEKAGRVAGVFTSVAARYDLMNDLMSGGIHRLWKRFTIELSAVRPGQRVLDIAGGTGDLSHQFARRVGDEGLVVLADINASMLNVGRDWLLDRAIGRASCRGRQENMEGAGWKEGKSEKRGTGGGW